MADGSALTPKQWERIRAVARPESESDDASGRTETSGVSGESPDFTDSDAFFESVVATGGIVSKMSPAPEREVESIQETTPRRIGAYRLVRRLGTGGMGAVYLAVREEAYHAEVAVKLLKWTSDREMQHRFRGERQILAGLEHPNIARLLDGGTTEDGAPFLVMEYVEGMPIDRYCAEHDLSPIERIRLFLQVCAAVDYAHRNLVVHRDLKPSNILVTSEGAPKLLDFGIAKLLSPDASAGFHETRTGFTPLTPRYASPEQVRASTITVASDVYSLGVLLFELLTGHPPYEVEGTSLSRLLDLICKAPVPKPSDICPKAESRRLLAGDLDNVILMALRKEPERRYATAGALAHDLTCFLQNRPVAATPDTLNYRLGKFVQRHRSMVAAVVIAVLCLLAGTALAVWQAGVAERERAVAEHRFDQVRQLAGSFLFDFDDAIKNLSGATPVRELVVQRALEYLDSLAQDATGDQSLQLELATAYQKVGDIQGNPFLSNLGRPDDALVSYEKAKSLLESLRSADEARARYATVLDRMGDLRAVEGDLDAAMNLQQQALSIRERLAASDPDDSDRLLDVASSRERLAELWNWKGNRSKALEVQQEAGRLYDQVLDRDGRTLRARRGKAVHLLKMGNLERPSSLMQAETEYRAAVEIFETLGAEDPTNAPLRRDLASALKTWAGAELATGKTDRALEHYQRALSISRELVAADPRDSRSRRDLAVSLGSVGSLFDSLHRRTEALECLSEAHEIFAGLAALDRGSGPLRDLALILQTLGDHFAGSDATQDRSALAEARHYYEQSRDIWHELAEKGILRKGDQSNLELAEQALECLESSRPGPAVRD